MSYISIIVSYEAVLHVEAVSVPFWVASKTYHRSLPTPVRVLGMQSPVLPSGAPSLLAPVESKLIESHGTIL